MCKKILFRFLISKEGLFMSKWVMKITGMVCAALLLFQAVPGGLAIAQGNTAPGSSPAYDNVKEQIIQVIEEEMKNSNIVGLSIALVDDQQIVWTEGFGYQDKERKTPATAQTIYQIGSLSKLFTSLAAMQMAEQGELDIDRPLQQYLPEFSMKSRFANSGPITARTIMTHHSGIPGNYYSGWFSTEPYTEQVKNLQNEYVAYPPNFVYNYSTPSFTILGHAVEKVSGKKYDDYMRDELLRPIGMQQSFFANDPPADNPLMSKCYSKGKEVKPHSLFDVPSGGLCANVDDMARFMQMIFGNGAINGKRVLKPASIAETLRKQNEHVPLDFDLGMGLGWHLGGWMTLPGYPGEVVWHDGEINEYFSLVVILPEHKLGVAVLANSNEAETVAVVALQTLALAVAEKTQDLQLNSKKVLRPVGTKLTNRDLRKYAGYYASAGTLCRLEQKRSANFLRIGDTAFPLAANGDGSYSVKAGALEGMAFTFDTVGGRDVMLYWNEGKKMMFGEKIRPVRLPSGWKKLDGTYQIVNRADLQEMPDTLVLKTQNDMLIWEYDVPELHLLGGKAQFTVLPVSATEGVVAGLGNGDTAGMTVTFKTVNGVQHFIFSGLDFKKIK